MKFVHDRVATLDRALAGPDFELGIDPDMLRFVRTMSQIQPGSVDVPTSPVDPRDVDAITNGSRLLGRLREKATTIVDGPIDPFRQFWIATKRLPHLAARKYALDERWFQADSTLQSRPTTKPFNLGLYSSTGALDTPGMWWCYLRAYDGSTLFRRPWRMFALRAAPGARILEITNAVAWVQLVDLAPLITDLLTYPDWPLVARQYDAVHMTARAVVAIQGVVFAGRHGPVAPAYWDVESTLWLRWCFESVSECSEGVT